MDTEVKKILNDFGLEPGTSEPSKSPQPAAEKNEPDSAYFCHGVALWIQQNKKNVFVASDGSFWWASLPKNLKLSAGDSIKVEPKTRRIVEILAQL